MILENHNYELQNPLLSLFRKYYALRQLFCVLQLSWKSISFYRGIMVICYLFERVIKKESD